MASARGSAAAELRHEILEVSTIRGDDSAGTAEHVADLVGEDQRRGAEREADEHPLRDVAAEDAEAKHAGDHLDQRPSAA